MPMNLIPGQYQIGDNNRLVVGKATNVKVTGFDPESYEIGAQDYQLQRSDEKRFGSDQLVPTTITITFNVMRNRIHPTVFNPQNVTDAVFSSQITVDELSSAWRFDSGRRVPGTLMPIYVCGQDGVTRVVYGRPGKFKYERRPLDYAGYIECVAEFRRADTVSYRADEAVIPMTMQQTPQWLTRLQGDCDAWFRILAEGPMENPVFTVGEVQVGLNYTIAAGEVVEISSYPQLRRCMNDKRVNLASKLTGTKYLDKLVIPPKTPVAVRWTSDEINTFIPALGNITWAEDIRDLNTWNLPSTFTNILGRVSVGFDLFNRDRPKKYLRSGLFGTRAAAIYNEKQYATAFQYMEAKIVQPYLGRSAIVMMSNSTMTNYVMLEVNTGSSNNFVKIRTGTSPTAYSTVRAQWENPALGGWTESDRIGIGFDPPTNTFSIYVNDIIRASWIDSGIIVNRSNRHAGVILDLDGNLFTVGTGFADLLGYDRATVPAPTGKAVLLWRDAWGLVA